MPAGSDNGSHDYIMVEDIIQDLADEDASGGDGQEATVSGPKDVQLVEDLVKHINEDDVVFGSPK